LSETSNSEQGTPNVQRASGLLLIVLFGRFDAPKADMLVNAGLKGLFFSRFENDLLPGILPEEPQNRRIPNRRISKENERSPIPTVDIRRS
jgi:hypothetical protein